MTAKQALDAVLAGARLTARDSQAAFADIFAGKADDATIAALLTALHKRGETVDEILGAVEAAWAVRNPLPWTAPDTAVDTCGTGGDGLQTFNVSTAVALAAARMGIPVVKHGNRAMSSKSGSADLLQALGYPLEPSADEALRQLTTRNFVFLFAPLYHPGFKIVAPIRKALGHRSIFNLLGPLLNPAAVKRQVIGVYAPQWVEPVARVLAERGAKRALVVHGGLPTHGTDELTTWGESLIAQVDGGRVTTRRFKPQSPLINLAEIQGDSATIVRGVLDGTAAPACLELVALNLSATMWAHRDDATPFEAHFARALDFLKVGA